MLDIYWAVLRPMLKFRSLIDVLQMLNHSFTNAPMEEESHVPIPGVCFVGETSFPIVKARGQVIVTRGTQRLLFVQVGQLS